MATFKSGLDIIDEIRGTNLSGANTNITVDDSSPTSDSLSDGTATEPLPAVTGVATPNTAPEAPVEEAQAGVNNLSLQDDIRRAERETRPSLGPVEDLERVEGIRRGEEDAPIGNAKDQHNPVEDTRSLPSEDADNALDSYFKDQKEGADRLSGKTWLDPSEVEEVIAGYPESMQKAFRTNNENKFLTALMGVARAKTPKEYGPMDYNQFTGELKSSVLEKERIDALIESGELSTTAQEEQEANEIYEETGQPKKRSLLEKTIEKRESHPEIIGTRRNSLGIHTKPAFMQQVDEDLLTMENVYKLDDKIGHMTKMTVEQSIESFAAMFDMVVNVNEWRKTAPQKALRYGSSLFLDEPLSFGLPDEDEKKQITLANGDVLTIEPRDPDAAVKAVRGVIKSFYKSIGQPPELEQLEDAWDSIPYIAGMILGSGKFIKEAAKVLDNATKPLEGAIKDSFGNTIGTATRADTDATAIRSFINGYNKAEAKAAVPAIISGTIVTDLWTDETSTSDERKTAAAIGTIVPAVPTALGILLKAKSLFKSTSNGKLMAQAEEEWTKVLSGEGEFSAATLKLIKAAGPEAEDIIKGVMDVRKEFPDFSPSIYLAVPDSKTAAMSRAVGRNFYAEELEQHQKNLVIFNQYLDKFADIAVAKGTNPNRPRGAGPVNSLGKDMGTIQRVIKAREKEIRNFQTMLKNDALLHSEAAKGASPVSNGNQTSRQLQEKLRTLKLAITEQVNVNYNAVDPDAVLSIPSNDIAKLIKPLLIAADKKSGKTSLTDPHVMGWMEDEFRKILKAKTSKEGGEEAASAGILMPDANGVHRTADEIADIEGSSKNLTYVQALDLLQSVNSQIGVAKKALDKKSPNLKTLKDLRNGILNTIQNAAIKSDNPKISERLEYANSYYREAFAPNFKVGSKDPTNVGGVFTETVADSAVLTFIKTSEDLGRKVWNPKDTEGLERLIQLADESPDGKAVLLALDQHIFAEVDTLLRNTKLDPYTAFAQYREKYRHSEKLLPHMVSEFDALAVKLHRSKSAEVNALEEAADLEKGIITKFTGLDGDGIADFLYGASLSQTREFITYLQKGATAEMRLVDGAVSNPSDYPSLAYPPNIEELNKVLSAVSHVFMNKVRQKSLDSAGEHIDSDKLNKFINLNEEKIELLLGPTRDGANSVKMLAAATKIDLKKLDPVSSDSINALRNFIGKFGISPESFVAKQYALHQQRISKVFVAVETATRTIFKMTDAISAAETRTALHNWDDFARGFSAKQKAIKDAEDTLNGDLAESMQEVSKALKDTAKGAFFKLSKKARNKVLLGAISTTNKLRPMILHEMQRGEEGLMSQKDRDVALYLAGLLEEPTGPDAVHDEEGLFHIIPSRNVRVPEPVSTDTTPTIPNEHTTMPGAAGSTEATLPPRPASIEELGEPTEEERAIFREASQVQSHRNKQRALSQEEITKTATLNPETGALTWPQQ